jgi:UbiD family decarboxylase
MAYKDIRTLMNQLEEKGKLHRIQREVDWDCELAGIMRNLYKQGPDGPAVLFENVKDSKIPFLSGIMYGDEKYAMLFDSEPTLKSIAAHWHERANGRIKPRVVENAPCQENVIMGDDVDVSIFPSPKYSPEDGGRYIGTLAVTITKDPDTNIQNIGIYRQMVMGKNKIGINCEQHTGIHMKKDRMAGRPTPFASVIGAPPAVIVSGAGKPPYGVDEMELAGSLAGEPIPVVKCKTNDLMIPADAEIVLEGYILDNTDQWELEGPFGEFHGHHNDTVPKKRPTAIVTCITHRNNPVFLGTPPGVGPNELTYSGKICYQASFHAALTNAGIPGVKAVHVTEMGCAGFVCIVQIGKPFYKGIPQACMYQLFSLGHFPKFVVVVDDDIDIFNEGMVQWAIASRVQPHRDVLITGFNTWGCSLDPSIPFAHRGMPGSTSSRMGIDATKYFKDDVVFSTLICDTPEMETHVKEIWSALGF